MVPKQPTLLVMLTPFHLITMLGVSVVVVPLFTNLQGCGESSDVAVWKN
ncbi:hypothetical protein RB2083_1276 [Rhodobacteraceae bacterium HTCC2083]|nr:hypothetical protein RB2083_1276 [Rhodobacteraceae bacterium HTCC2083]